MQMHTYDTDGNLPTTKFRRNWFQRRNQKTLERLLLPRWAGKPGIRYLEIGVFEGASLRWMLSEVLTDPTSSALGIDPWLPTPKLTHKHGMERATQFMDECFLNACHNLRSFCDRVVLVRRPSSDLARPRPILLPISFGRVARDQETPEETEIVNASLDLALIDGDHSSRAVLQDAESVLPLLKPGGWMIFDDYRNAVEKPHHVKEGYHWFIDEHCSEVEEIWQHAHMVAVAKIG